MRAKRWHLGMAVLAIAFALGRDARAEPRVVDRIIAIVDHRPILLSDVLVHAAPDLAQAKKDGGEAALASATPLILRATLDRMIDEMLVGDAAKTENVVVDDHEIDLAFEAKQRDLGFTKPTFLAAIAELGLDEASYRNMLKTQIVEFKWLLRAFAAERARITPAAIEERLQRLRQKDAQLTEADAKKSLENDAYAAARQSRMTELRRAHFIEVRL